MSDIDLRSRIQRLFHESMRIILNPLKEAGQKSVKIRNSKGEMQQIHPFLCCYVADYPEQCLVSCSKSGTCPKCRQTADNLQSLTKESARTTHWTKSVILNAKENASESISAFSRTCLDKDVIGGTYDPFWSDPPYTDIHKAITPDILHQLYQGLFKHLVGWCQSIVGEKELDQRIRSLSHGQGLRRFKNGISALSQISGSERKNMAKILLACVHDVLAPRGVQAIKALLDFIYLAQYTTHDTITLSYLEDTLKKFHQDKKYFIDVGCREHLNIPKLHSLIHYVDSIKLFGTTDNYNTEMFERLHIDFAKQGWRATNQRDEFLQMIRWLSRQEKIDYFKHSLASRLQPLSDTPLQNVTNSASKRSTITLAKKPQYSSHPLQIIQATHNCPQLQHHLKQYLNNFLPEPLLNHQIQASIIPFNNVDVYSMFRFHPETIQDDDEDDIVKAIPSSMSHPEGRFDTVIFIDNENAEATGLEGKRNNNFNFHMVACVNTNHRNTH